VCWYFLLLGNAIFVVDLSRLVAIVVTLEEMAHLPRYLLHVR